MSTIRIERNHTLGEEVVRDRVAQIEPMLEQKYGVRLAWRGTDADVQGRGVKGTVRITGESVSINLKLGLVVRPFSGKIRSAMESRIDEALS
jgi:putative polyhydroxyalkanoate system protein